MYVLLSQVAVPRRNRVCVCPIASAMGVEVTVIYGQAHLPPHLFVPGRCPVRDRLL